jgi:hypothetical protein
LWIDARDEAYSLGGYLATITEPSENAFILNNLLSGASLHDYWLGGYLEDTNWTWITSEEWNYTNWWITEPSGDGPRLEIYATPRGYPDKPGRWNDVPLTHLAEGYIIEVPEPTTLLLLVFGGLALRRKRRAK